MILVLMIWSLWLGVVWPTQAAPVTFWFGGRITYVYNYSNAMPFVVHVGTPFTGRFTYDVTAEFGGYTNLVSAGTGTTTGHYFNTLASFSCQMEIDGHVLTNGIRPGTFCGIANTYRHYNDEDSLYVDSGSGELMLGGVPLATASQFSSFGIYLADFSQTALDDAGLPTGLPDLDKFPDTRLFSWGLYLDDGRPTQLFRVEGEVTTLASAQPAFLKQELVGAGQLRLSWLKTLTGFTLQASPNLATGTWRNVTNAVTDLGLYHTVTVPVSGAPGFYRLIK